MRISAGLTFILIASTALSNCSYTANDRIKTPQEYHGKGTIVSVDSEKAIAAIDHEEIKGLMSAMTMDFPVAGKNLLAGLESGDEVNFTLRKAGDDLKITAIKKTGAKLADGGALFKTNCARCHGDKGQGAKKGIPLIKGHALGHPVEDFIDQVTNGGKKMPAFSDKLSEAEIASVVKYVREEIQNGLRKEEAHEH